MMAAYTLQLTTESDVSPAANRERGFATPVSWYLPGGAVRGALAARWIAQNGDPARAPERFATEVLGLRIGPGIAEGAGQRPLSVYACKYPVSPDCATALDAAFGEAPASGRCPGCDRPVEASKGQWEGEPRRRTRTRTALTDEGTAAAGQLFSREVLAAGQAFRSRALGDLRWCEGEAFPLRVGGRRSVGGQMTARVTRSEQPEPASPGPTIVIRLIGPAVFLANDARTLLQPTPSDLRRALRGSPQEALAEEITVTGAWWRTETFGGWNAAAGLPKSTEVVVAPASTYALTMPDGAPWQSATIAALHTAGLGVRRTDGLGWIEVAQQAWRPSDAPTANAGRAAAHPDVSRIADDLDKLGSPAFRRQVAGWVSDGFLGGTDSPPGAAYEGLPTQSRVIADAALALGGDQRRALIITLAARGNRTNPREGAQR